MLTETKHTRVKLVHKFETASSTGQFPVRCYAVIKASVRPSVLCQHIIVTSLHQTPACL